MLAAAAFLDLGIDGARDDVTSGKLHALGIVLLHEAFAELVAKNAALAPHRLRDQNPLHARRPHHSSGVELHKLHVFQVCPGIVGKRHSVSGVLPRVRGNGPCFADSSGRNHD